MKYVRLLILALLAVIYCPAQHTTGDQEKAARLGQEAVNYMRSGQNDIAIKQLQKAQRLDPDALFYPLQIAFAWYLNASYRKAIDLLSHLQYHPKSNASVYALLHKCLLVDQQTERAEKTLEEGLKKFPRSGQLCLEKALIYYEKGRHDYCMYWLNRGVELDPAYSNTYLYRAILFYSNDQRTEAAMNAEIYLQGNSQLQADVASKILYKVYSDSLTLQYTQPDSSWNQQLQALSGKYVIGALDSLATRLYEYGAEGFLQSGDRDLREKLQAYRNKVVAAGHLQAYIYGLFRFADPMSFLLWKSNNAKSWQNFQQWRGQKKVLVSGEPSIELNE